MIYFCYKLDTIEEIEDSRNDGKGDDEQLLDDLHWSFPLFLYNNKIFIIRLFGVTIEMEAKKHFIQKLHINPIIPLQN